MVYELVIIGAGLTGIRSALTAQDIGLKDVLIIDYQKRIGGFSSNLFNRVEFQEEQKLIAESKKLIYDCWFQSTVIGVFTGEDGEPHLLSVQTPSGTKDIRTKKIIFSPGSIEKPREAHRISGTRPAGVMTPQLALGLLERGLLPGYQIVVIQNGKNSKALSNLLEEHGAKVINISGEAIKITNIRGNSRVNEVKIIDLKSGEEVIYPCDTLIFSEGIIPCTFFLKGTPIEQDSRHFIIVDGKGRTNIPGVFAFGSCTQQTFDYFSISSIETLKEVLTPNHTERRLT